MQVLNYTSDTWSKLLRMPTCLVLNCVCHNLVQLSYMYAPNIICSYGYVLVMQSEVHYLVARNFRLEIIFTLFASCYHWQNFMDTIVNRMQHMIQSKVRNLIPRIFSI